MIQHLLKEGNYTYTNNGALSYASTQNYCVDLFACIGALREQNQKFIIEKFVRAFAEDKDTALKILFYARDVREGLGERYVFKTILKFLAKNYPDTVIKNLSFIVEFGRYDDLLELIYTPCETAVIELIKQELQKDLNALCNGKGVSLLAKWLPSINASNTQTIMLAKRLSQKLGYDKATYRKTLVKLRKKINIIENYLREKDYTFSYQEQPSKALFKYRAAFSRNDEKRYFEYLDNVQKGKCKLNTSTLSAYEVVMPYYKRVSLSKTQQKTMDATWNALQDHTSGEDSLVVLDGSGSMYCCGTLPPIAVATSLALYFAERNKGAFKGHFITFSRNAKLVRIKGDNIVEKLQYCSTFNEAANTNLQNVFNLLLNTAVKNNLTQADMPKTLYIVSDMEFDCCVEDANLTNFQSAKKAFEQAGYVLPNIVFWNVATKSKQVPVVYNEQGVALVSGTSTRLFSMVTKGDLNPYNFMMEIISRPRYKKIVA